MCALLSSLHHCTNLAYGCSQDEDDPDVIKWSVAKAGKKSGFHRSLSLQRNKKMSKVQYSALVDLLEQHGLQVPDKRTIESTAKLSDEYRAVLEEARHSVLLALP